TRNQKERILTWGKRGDATRVWSLGERQLNGWVERMITVGTTDPSGRGERVLPRPHTEPRPGGGCFGRGREPLHQMRGERGDPEVDQVSVGPRWIRWWESGGGNLLAGTGDNDDEDEEAIVEERQSTKCSLSAPIPLPSPHVCLPNLPW